jgi:hypothetical protein
MKAEFPGYFPITTEGEKSAWKNGLFSFDASVLLDLYRYSDETKEELLNLFKSLGPRLWITHQAGQEFLDGRLGVIGSQSKLYDDSIVLIDRIEKMFKSARGHPFLTKELLSESESHFKKLCSYLNGKKSYLHGLISKDPIREEVAALLEGRIGAPFPKKRLQELVGEGETRYKDKIPPGYEDAKKADGNNRFGDLIIWFQLIEKAQKAKTPITFVTADEKEDWWKIFQGKTIGPRPELIAEFKDKAGVEFQMFSPDRFMKAAREKLSQEIKEAAIEEVREVRKADVSLAAAAALERLEKVRGQAASGWSGFPQYGYSGFQSDATKRLGLDLGEIYQELQREQQTLQNLQKQAEPFSEIYERLRMEEVRLRALQNQINPGLEIYQKLLAEQERIKALEKQVKDYGKPR